MRYYPSIPSRNSLRKDTWPTCLITFCLAVKLDLQIAVFLASIIPFGPQIVLTIPPPRGLAKFEIRSKIAEL